MLRSLVGSEMCIRDSSTPGAKLMVKGTGTNPTLNVVTSTGTVPALRVNDNERVGLGTSMPATKLHIKDGDVYLDNPNNGVVLTSPNGSCFIISVDDSGNISASMTTCP